MKKSNAEKTLSPSLFKETINRLEDKFDNFADRLTRTEGKVDSIIRKMDTEMATKKDLEVLKVQMDHFAGQSVDLNNKAIMNTYRIRELEPVVADHEKRLSALEKKV